MVRPLFLALMALAGGLLLAPPARAGDGRAAASSFFAAYDTNGDGRVTKEEIGVEDAVFALLDLDGDGFITLPDLGLPAGTDLRPAPRPRAKPAQPAAPATTAPGGDPGKKGAGKGGKGATPGPGSRPRRLDGESDEDWERRVWRRTLRAMDRDGDGRVSLAEYTGREPFERLDRNHDGFLDRQDLPPPPGGGDEAFDARFEAMDRDGDGKLSVDELPRPGLLGRLDTNRDGFVSRAEARAGLRRAGRGRKDGNEAGLGRPRGLSRAALRRFDRNRDGKVEREEFPGSDERFDALDTNHDGVLTREDVKPRPAPAPPPKPAD